MLIISEVAISEGQIALLVSCFTLLALVIQLGDRLWGKKKKEEIQAFTCKYNPEVINEFHNKFNSAITLLNDTCQIMKTHVELTRERNSHVLAEIKDVQKNLSFLKEQNDRRNIHKS